MKAGKTKRAAGWIWRTLVASVLCWTGAVAGRADDRVAQWRSGVALEGMEAVEGGAKVGRDTKELLWQVLKDTTGAERLQRGRPRLVGTNEWGGTYDLPFETGDGVEQHLGVACGDGESRAVRYWTAEGLEAVSNPMPEDAERFVFGFLGGQLSGSSAVFSARRLLRGGTDRVIVGFGGEELPSPFERYWFFFVDDAPLCNWGHPARCVFVKDNLSALAIGFCNMPANLQSEGVRADLAELELDSRTLLPHPKIHVPKRVAHKGTTPKAAFTPLGGGDASHCHALLVSGGGDVYNNHGRYWNDICFAYNVLRQRYGIPRGNIKVLWGSGNPSQDLCWINKNCCWKQCDQYEWPRVALSDFDRDGTGDVTAAATRAELKSALEGYARTLKTTDQLFIFVTDHGNYYQAKGNDEAATICTWGGAMSDTEFASLTQGIKCPVMVAMETCFSGGMVEEFLASAQNRAIATADGYDESDGGNLAMDVWAYNFFSALCGYYPAGTYKADHGFANIDTRSVGAKCNADSDGDGKISFYEAAQFAIDKNPISADLPEKHAVPANLGKKLFMVQYADAPAVVVKEKVATPVLTPSGGSVGYAPATVKARCWTAGATIRYTLDGSEPTGKSAVAEGGVIALSKDATVKVRGFKSGMEGSATATGSYTVSKSAPAKATIMSVTRGGQSSGIVVDWLAGAGTATCDLLRSESSAMSSPKTVAGGLAADVTSWADLTVVPGKTYYYQIRSVNAYGKTLSAVSAGAWLALQAPGGVTAAATSVKVGSATITIRWNATGGASHYRVWREGVDGALTAVGGWQTATSLVVTVPLTGGTQSFSYRVQAASSSSGAGASGYSAAAVAEVNPADAKGTLIVCSPWWSEADKGLMTCKPGGKETYYVRLRYEDGSLEDRGFTSSPSWTVTKGSGLTLTGSPASGTHSPSVLLTAAAGAPEQIATVKATWRSSAGVTYSREFPVYVSENGIVESLGIGTYPCVIAGETLELKAYAYVYGSQWSQALPAGMEVEWSVVGGGGATVTEDGDLTAWEVAKATNVTVQAKSETAFGTVIGRATLNVLPKSALKKQTATIPPLGGYSTNLVGKLGSGAYYECTSNSWISGYAYHGGNTTNPADATIHISMGYGRSSVSVPNYMFISFKAERNPGTDRETVTKLRWKDGGIDFTVLQKEAPYAKMPSLSGGENGVVRVAAATDGGVFRYATDGEEPSSSSPIMSNALSFDDDTELAVKSYGQWLQASGTAYADVTGRNSVWDQITVKFSPGQSGAKTPAARTYKVNETFGALPTYPKTGGRYFKGWTLVEGSERVVSADEAVPSVDCTLYGVWSATSEAKPDFTALPWNFQKGMTATMVVSNMATGKLLGPDECTVAVLDGNGVCRGSSESGLGGMTSPLHGKNGLHVFGVYSDAASGTETGLKIRVWVKGEGWGDVGNGGFAFAAGGEEGSATAPRVVVLGNGKGWYHLAFSAGAGGTGQMGTVDVPVGTATTLPACGFLWDGYAFAGWGKKVSGSVSYAAGWRGKPTKANGKAPGAGETLTLHAQWTPTRQTVSFNANGGTCPQVSSVHAVGAAYGPLPTPAKAGAAFSGWYTAKSGGKKVTETTEVTVAAARTLYAHWTTTQTLTYNANGGKCPTKSKKVTIGKKYGALATATKAGHGFVGWGDSPESGVTVRAENLVTASAARTVYAQWTTNQIVAFDGNGGSSAVPAKTCTIGGTYGDLPGASSSTGVLEGWYTAKKGGTKVTAASKVTDSATRTLYAHWTTTQTLTYNANGGKCPTKTKKVTIGKKYGALATATKAGYGFAGWEDAPEGGVPVTADDLVTAEASRTVYAQWTTTQTVTFDANGGSTKTPEGTFTIGETYGSLPTATKAGVGFAGWYTAKKDGSKVTAASKVTEKASRTLYAHWTKTQTLTYNANGGKCSTKTKKVTIGKKYGTLATATKAGYGFAGWEDAPEEGEPVTAADMVTEAASRTVYAQWTTNQVVTFDANGGTSDTAEGTYTIGATYGELPTATKAGTALAGWYTAKKDGSKVTVTAKVTEKATRTLYAHWTTTQTVTFNANGGKCSTKSKKYTVGKTYASLPKATWAGHEFSGWVTEDGVLVAVGGAVPELSARTLYAQWDGVPKTKPRAEIRGIALRGAKNENRAQSAENTCVLSVEEEAGVTYAIQWTPALGGEWTTVQQWTATADGTHEVEVPMPHAATGFLRVVAAGE